MLFAVCLKIPAAPFKKKIPGAVFVQRRLFLDRKYSLSPRYSIFLLHICPLKIQLSIKEIKLWKQYISFLTLFLNKTSIFVFPFHILTEAKDKAGNY